MKKIKAFFVAMMAMCSLSTFAQEAKTEFNPHWYFDGKVGGQYTLGAPKFMDLISPNAQVGIGYNFTPGFGMRLSANGWQSKAGWKDEVDLPHNTYKWNYVAPQLDFVFNLSNLFAGYNPKRLVDVSLFAGAAANIGWNNKEANENYAVAGGDYAVYNFSPNPNWQVTDGEPFVDYNWTGTKVRAFGRVGLDVDFRVSERVKVGLEAAANVGPNTYNSKRLHGADWYFNALVGVKVALGKTTKNVAPDEPIFETRIDTTWYDVDEYTDRIVDGTISWNVFYEIRESEYIDADKQLAKIGDFLKDHRECKVSIKSYADAQTGNPKINMEYSKQRSEKAIEALVNAGVSRDIITAEYFGDTVQPFSDNDKNRVSIITATGLRDIKDKRVVKKFRTKEVRYRVK